MEQQQLAAKIEREKQLIRKAMRFLLMVLAAWIVALSASAQTVSTPKLTQQTGGVLVEFDVTHSAAISQYIIHLVGSNGKKIDILVPAHGDGHYSTFVKV